MEGPRVQAVTNTGRSASVVPGSDRVAGGGSILCCSQAGCLTARFQSSNTAEGARLGGPAVVSTEIGRDPLLEQRDQAFCMRSNSSAFLSTTTGRGPSIAP